MKPFKLFIHSLLLLTMPFVLIYPQDIMTNITCPVQKVDFEAKQRDLCSCDEILQLLEEIESGELENKCTPEELERIKSFIAFLAKEGALPDDSDGSLSLDDDIEDLLNGDDNLVENTFFFKNPNDYQYMIVPAVMSGYGRDVLCKSWFKKQWKHVKTFVKKHKKPLL